jgi:hypothetical protein
MRKTSLSPLGCRTFSASMMTPGFSRGPSGQSLITVGSAPQTLEIVAQLRRRAIGRIFIFMKIF